MGNCLKVANKEEKKTFAENVLFNNRLNMREIRYRHLSPKGYIYCVRDRGHGVLMLYFEFEYLHRDTLGFGQHAEMGSIYIRRETDLKLLIESRHLQNRKRERA